MRACIDVQRSEKKPNKSSETVLEGGLRSSNGAPAKGARGREDAAKSLATQMEDVRAMRARQYTEGKKGKGERGAVVSGNAGAERRGLSAAELVLKSLEEDLTCSICLELLARPVTVSPSALLASCCVKCMPAAHRPAQLCFIVKCLRHFASTEAQNKTHCADAVAALTMHTLCDDFIARMLRFVSRLWGFRGRV